MIMRRFGNSRLGRDNDNAVVIEWPLTIRIECRTAGRFRADADLSNGGDRCA